MAMAAGGAGGGVGETNLDIAAGAAGGEHAGHGVTEVGAEALLDPVGGLQIIGIGSVHGDLAQGV